jgi:TonB-linked SusC/RagA family outer membrane protein
MLAHSPFFRCIKKPMNKIPVSRFLFSNTNIKSMKNTLSVARVPHPLQKLLLIMKLTCILTVFCVLDTFAHVNAQTVTLTMQDAEISKVLTVIEKETSFRFLYNSRLRELKQKVDVAFTNADIAEVMTTLFARTNLTYRRLENNLIAIRSEEKADQDKRVTGRITNDANEPLAGASVAVKGTSRGTSSDANGDFELAVPDNATLIISAVGYQNQEIVVGTQTTLVIKLLQTTIKMDEIVVIGYGTASKRDLTGSIAKVTGREVADKPNTNPIASIQGKVAGVSVVNSGQPGQEPDIRIRGTVSRFQTKPLYVVDGLLNDNINFVNPADIESIEVLKDPSSLAIFGVRGANGVIIVTTKKAKTGQMIVNVNSTYGVKKIVDKVEMTNASEFKMLFDEQLVNQGEDPFPYYNLYQGNTDWVDLISNKSATVNTNNISITSGTEKNKFYFGLGYIKEEGLINYETLEKILLNINDELRINRNIKIGFTLNGYRALLPQLHDFGAAINATPIVEPIDEATGLYNKLPDQIGGPQIGNPLMGVEATRNTDLSREYRAIGSIYGEITFLKNFTFRASYYADLGFNDQRRYTPFIQVYAADFDEIAPQAGFNFTRVYQKENKFQKFQQEYLLTFKKDFGDHGLTAMTGFTTYYNDYSETNGQVTQVIGGNPIPNDKRFWYLDNFFGDRASKVSGISPGNDLFGNPQPLQWEQATVSYLLRALYNYKGKYLLNASFRRDGSSEIPTDNRYQNFIAVGAAWEMSREDFMASQKIFDYLKIKGSWGVLGNQYVGIHYPFFPQLTGGSTAVFGNNIVNAFIPSYLPDPNLKWETVSSIEGGVEFFTLRNRLRVEANYFYKVTDNLLTVIPGIGGARPGITNAGKIQNNGIEASATWTDKLAGGITYSISGNITTLNNKVKELYQEGFEIIDGSSRVTVGQPIGYFYGYVHDGIYQSYADKLDAPNASSLGDYGPGDIRFKDIDGDGDVDVNDRTFIGNPTPDFIYGFSFSANWKGFDAGIDFQGVYGNEIFRDWGNGNTFAFFNYRADRLGRWHGEGTSSWEPQLNDMQSINKQASTYMIEDGSYLRIRNVQVGYNFSSNLLSKVYIKTLRLFVNAQNLKTFKRNSGFSPEFGGSAIRFGVDGGSYPVPAIYSAGINVTF